MSRAAAELVALVTDGLAIDGYGTRCEKCGQPTDTSDGRKTKFLKLGRAVMKDLAKELGFGPKDVHVNPAGPMVSGDVYIHGEGLYVLFSKYDDRPAFLVRRFDTSLWVPWKELLEARAEDRCDTLGGARCVDRTVGRDTTGRRRVRGRSGSGGGSIVRRLIPGDEVVCVRTGKTHTVTGAFYDKEEPYYAMAADDEPEASAFAGAVSP